MLKIEAVKFRWMGATRWWSDTSGRSPRNSSASSFLGRGHV